MTFKVNYGLERAERNRAKLAKKEAKSLARKAQADDSAASDPADENSDSPASEDQPPDEK